MNIETAQNHLLNAHIPFYAYRLPADRKTCLGIQTEGEVSVFRRFSSAREGFVLVPFRDGNDFPPCFIRQDRLYVDSVEEGEMQRLCAEIRPCRRQPEPSPEMSKEEYFRKISTLLDLLKDGKVEKAVLSRNLFVPCNALNRAPHWFSRLSAVYPDAFVFLVHIPGVVTWMGATPELFLKQDESGADTMALAGTRPSGTVSAWGEKELEEQRIVTRCIASQLEGNGEWIHEGPHTRSAGKVEHLCTTFHSSGCFSDPVLDRIRKTLHPTPAVGGYPRDTALSLLTEIERYDRRYYSGYLGPVTGKSRFQWYVNLRSMELSEQGVTLYVGGGITALSDPEREWIETCLKSRTLLDIITENNS